MAFLSDLMGSANTALSSFGESPVASVMGPAIGAWLLAKRHPRFASGLANLAVNEIFRPAQEKSAMQQLLLTHPELTTTPAPPGFKGPSLTKGGMTVRRLGTLGEERASEFGPGVIGTNLQPANAVEQQRAMGNPPFIAPPPAPLPAAYSRFSVAEQPTRAALGELPSTPEGRVAATKALLDAQTLREQRAQNAATTQQWLNFAAEHPGMGLQLGTGKSGQPTVGLKTFPPQRPVRPVPMVNDGRKVYGFPTAEGTITPTDALVPPTAGGAPKPQKLSDGSMYFPAGSVPMEDVQRAGAQVTPSAQQPGAYTAKFPTGKPAPPLNLGNGQRMFLGMSDAQLTTLQNNGWTMDQAGEKEWLGTPPPKPLDQNQVWNAAVKMKADIVKRTDYLKGIDGMLTLVKKEVNPDGTINHPIYDAELIRQAASMETVLGNTAKARVNEADARRLMDAIPLYEKAKYIEERNLNNETLSPPARQAIVRVMEEMQKYAKQMKVDTINDVLSTRPPWMPYEWVVEKSMREFVPEGNLPSLTRPPQPAPVSSSLQMPVGTAADIINGAIPARK